jgi:glucose-1-phosphate cytidylyltransferase
LDYIDGDETAFENGSLQKLSHDGELMAYRRSGFWHCMDNIRDKQTLEKLWNEGNAPWKIWE